MFSFKSDNAVYKCARKSVEGHFTRTLELAIKKFYIYFHKDLYFLKLFLSLMLLLYSVRVDFKLKLFFQVAST